MLRSVSCKALSKSSEAGQSVSIGSTCAMLTGRRVRPVPAQREAVAAEWRVVWLKRESRRSRLRTERSSIRPRCD